LFEQATSWNCIILLPLMFNHHFVHLHLEKEK
jgi:hypothetical protein